jgi:hypothetical protein
MSTSIWYWQPNLHTTAYVHSEFPNALYKVSSGWLTDTGESPRRKHTTFRTWRKFEIKNVASSTAILIYLRKEYTTRVKIFTPIWNIHAFQIYSELRLCILHDPWCATSFFQIHHTYTERLLHILHCHAGLWFPSSRVQTRPKPLDFYECKNPQHAFLRRGSESICPMSQLCSM